MTYAHLQESCSVLHVQVVMLAAQVVMLAQTSRKLLLQAEMQIC